MPLCVLGGVEQEALDRRGKLLAADGALPELLADCCSSRAEVLIVLAACSHCITDASARPRSRSVVR